MASIFTKNGKLYVAVMVYDPETGKNKQKKKSTGLKDTPANRKLVETKIVPKLEKEIREGKIKAPKKQITIKELSEEFLKLKEASNARHYTVKEYRQMFNNHILPKFGDRTPISITANEIEKWQVWLLQEKELKAKTVKNIRVPFQGLFDLAIKKRLIDENPFEILGSQKKIKLLSPNLLENWSKTVLKQKKLSKRLNQAKPRDRRIHSPKLN